MDWKTARQENLKNTFHFQISKCKRIIITRRHDKIHVTGEVSYRNNIAASASLLKKGKKIVKINPIIVKGAPSVKQEKLVDVRNLLLKHFGSEWHEIPQLQYYKNILHNNIGSIEESEDDAINNSEAYGMEEVFDFV